MLATPSPASAAPRLHPGPAERSVLERSGPERAAPERVGEVGPARALLRPQPLTPAASSAPGAALGAAVVAAPSAPAQSAEELLARMLDATREQRLLRVVVQDLIADALRDDGAGCVLVVRPGEGGPAAVRAVLGELTTLATRCHTRACRVEVDAGPAHASGGAAQAPAGPTVADVSEHPLVKHAAALFGARVTGVQARQKD